MRIFSTTTLVLALCASTSAMASDNKEISKDIYLQAIEAKFALADKDQDGRLSPDEAVLIGEKDAKKQHDQRRYLLAKYDANNDNQLDLAEQIELVEGYKKINYSWAGSNAREVAKYQRIDENVDGVVSLDEYIHHSRNLFFYLDRNKDGILQRREIKGSRNFKTASHPWISAPSQLE